MGLVTVWAVSIISFLLIIMPPGDFVTAHVAALQASGDPVKEEEVEHIRKDYGLDQPIFVQYYKWASKVVRGNFGVSMQWQRPVREVIGDRMWLTIAVALAGVVFTYILALPIGIYSAVKQYSLGDYTFTFVGFIGLAVPNFLVALVLLYLGFAWFNASIGGLFSDEYIDAPYSVGKALVLKRLFFHKNRNLQGI